MNCLLFATIIRVFFIFLLLFLLLLLLLLLLAVMACFVVVLMAACLKFNKYQLRNLFGMFQTYQCHCHWLPTRFAFAAGYLSQLC